MKRIMVLFLVLEFCLGLAIPSYASLTDGLEVYYPFDVPLDGNNTVLDLSGNNKNGTAYGDLQYAEGKFGFAAQFDGLNDYISGPSIEVKDKDFTVSFWFKTTDTEGYMLDARQGIGYEQGYYLISFDKPSAGIYFGLQGTGGSTQVSSTDMADDSWHMATGIRSGKEITFYMDGIQIASDNTDNLLGLDVPPIYLGCRYRNAGSGYYYYEGLLDDFRLYSRALSAEEVTELYNMSQVPIPATFWLMAGGLLGLLGARKRGKSTRI